MVKDYKEISLIKFQPDNGIFFYLFEINIFKPMFLGKMSTSADKL